MDLRDRKVLVMGMARSGVAAATLAVRRGARVTCTDRRADAPRVEGAAHVYGEHRREDFLGADLVVVSPGVPAAQADVTAARAAGVTVLGELAFAAAQLPEVRLYAVSGTNGKSTTTALLGQLFERAGLRTFTGGNLGRPLSEAVGGSYEIAAVEVSSYQMELPGDFHPRGAAILNLTPDHLERHGDMDSYGAHKCRLFAHMGPGDAQVLPAGDARLARIAATLPGARYYLGDWPGVRWSAGAVELRLEAAGPVETIPLAGLALPGAHNRANFAAAALLARHAGLDLAQLDPAGLRGLPHRMEVVGVKGGVTWIDDSKATNVESTLAGIDGFAGPYWLLLGGRAKARSAWESLVRPLLSARGVLTFGEAGPEIADALERAGLPVLRHDSLDAAVARVAGLARAGESVLLSPACASFDAFTDFEHRGRHFAALVEALP